MIWLRSVAFNVWFFGLTLVMCFGALPLRLMRPQFAIAYARSWAWLVLAGLRVICGITWQVTGLERLPRGEPALLASMHQSAFDTLIWAVLTPGFAYVLKRELTRIPLFGPMLLLSGMIPVDRGGGPTALRALLRAADRAVAERRHVVIFPEGTRVAPGKSAPLQPGVAALAARMRVPVIPVVTDSGLRWGRRAFRKQPGVIHVTLLAPLPPGLPREALLERLHAAFITAARQAVDNSVGEPPAGL